MTKTIREVLLFSEKPSLCMAPSDPLPQRSMQKFQTARTGAAAGVQSCKSGQKQLSPYGDNPHHPYSLDFT